MEDKILTFLESIDSLLIEINAHLVFMCQYIESSENKKDRRNAE